MVAALEGQLPAAERAGLARMLAAWPRTASGGPERPEPLQEGLAALLDQARAQRRADIGTAIKHASWSGAFGAFCSLLVHAGAEIALAGRTWTWPEVFAWLGIGVPGLVFAAFGFWQARAPTRLTRTLFRGFVALPAGGLGAALLLLLVIVAIDDALPEGTMERVGEAWLVAGLVLGSLAGGVTAAAWAMRRAWRRWDETTG